MEEVATNPTIELPELTPDGEIDSWWEKNPTELSVHQNPEEKSSDSDPQETDPDLPGSVQESAVEAWVAGGLLQGRGH